MKLVLTVAVLQNVSINKPKEEQNHFIVVFHDKDSKDSIKASTNLSLIVLSPSVATNGCS